MKNPRRNVMNSINIDRQELLELVLANKTTHVAEFQESVKDYKAAVLQIARDNLALAKTGKLDEIAKVKAMPPKPISYEAEYNRAVRMLELSVDSVIELEQDVFNQLVLDEWDWKHTFVTNSMFYKTFQ